MPRLASQSTRPAPRASNRHGRPARRRACASCRDAQCAWQKTAYDLSPELTTPYAILDVTSQTPTRCGDRAFSPLLGKHWAEAAWQSCKVYDGVDRAKDVAWWAAVVAKRTRPSARAAARSSRRTRSGTGSTRARCVGFARLVVRRHEQRVNFAVTHCLVAAQVL